MRYCATRTSMAEGVCDIEMETFGDAGDTGDDAQETSFITGTDDDTVNLPDTTKERSRSVRRACEKS